MAQIGKRTKAARVAFEGKELVTVEEAVKLIKSAASAKFDETLEIAMNLGVDPRHADQMVRGVVNLPKGTGKDVRVAVFAKGDKAEEAKKAGVLISFDPNIRLKLWSKEEARRVILEMVSSNFRL